MKGTIEAFTLAIPLRVIRHTVHLLDTVHLTWFLHQCQLKVPALVTADAFWDPLAAEPILDKDLNHSYRLLVPCGDCYDVLCEHISHDKNPGHRWQH